jgi:CBS domain-containing protein
MAIDNDESDRMLDEECPGPTELESALTHDTLADVAGVPPLVLDAATPLAETVRRMQDERRACVLLVEDGRLAGVFTERDVLMKLAGRGIDLEHTKTSALMTRDPLTLEADSSVAFALNKMVVEGFRHIPLVDDAGRPVAVISMRNLIEYLGEFFSRDLLHLPPDSRSARFRNREGA